MNRIAQMTASARADMFAATADRKGLPEAVVEKDFWVCWVLKQIFSIKAFSGRLLFKGGTSLSKVFNAIDRDMAVMIFGDPPSFESILKTLAQLELEMNAIAGG